MLGSKCIARISQGFRSAPVDCRALTQMTLINALMASEDIIDIPRAGLSIRVAAVGEVVIEVCAKTVRLRNKPPWFYVLDVT